MIYILHGEDEFSRSEFVGRLKARLGDPSTADLSVVVLDGASVSIEEIVHHCATAPFLTDRRLVIVERMLSRVESKTRQGSGTAKRGAKSDGDNGMTAGLLEYLPRLPDFTDLVFAETQRLQQRNPIIAFAGGHEKLTTVRLFDPLRGEVLTQWIVDRGQDKGIRVDQQAARELSIHVGNNLRLLDHELEKLSLYVGRGQWVTRRDVAQLVSVSKQARIFDMVDCLGERRPGRAVNLLHKLIDEGSSPLYLLSMIVRQFRMIGMYRELAAMGSHVTEIQRELGIHHSFILDKVSRQSRNFAVEQLRGIHCRLLDVDQQIKTGRMDAILALDLLVVELTA